MNSFVQYDNHFHKFLTFIRSVRVTAATVQPKYGGLFLSNSRKLINSIPLIEQRWSEYLRMHCIWHRLPWELRNACEYWHFHSCARFIVQVDQQLLQFRSERCSIWSLTISRLWIYHNIRQIWVLSTWTRILNFKKFYSIQKRVNGCHMNGFTVASTMNFSTAPISLINFFKNPFPNWKPDRWPELNGAK